MVSWSPGLQRKIQIDVTWMRNTQASHSVPLSKNEEAVMQRVMIPQEIEI